MTTMRKVAAAVVLTSLLGGPSGPAQAQFAVIDMASVTQLIQQVQTMAQQLQTARAELVQAQALYQSTTGARGMQQLLSGTVRNYLPTNAAELNLATQGTGNYGALNAQVRANVIANAWLSPVQLAGLPAQMRSQIAANRDATALQQALAQSALSNSSARFTSLQMMINAIGAATDQKSILELQARISAEQGMLQNEQSKLQALYQAAQAQQAALVLRDREQIVAAQGEFATRFEPSPR
jgi:type IV secretion system protein VirB5